MTFDVLSTAAETARARRFGSCGVVRFTEGSDSASTPCADLMAGLPSPNLIFEKTESASP